MTIDLINGEYVLVDCTDEAVQYRRKLRKYDRAMIRRRPLSKLAKFVLSSRLSRIAWLKYCADVITCRHNLADYCREDTADDLAKLERCNCLCRGYIDDESGQVHKILPGGLLITKPGRESME